MPTTPDPLGGLLNLPDVGSNTSLFQSVPLSQYDIYFKFNMLSPGDWLPAAAVALYQFFATGTLLLVRVAIALTWWLNDVMATDGLGTRVGDLMSQGSAQIAGWLLPTALGVGAVIAWTKARGGEEVLQQLLAVVGAGLLAVGLSTAGGTIIGGLDQGRQLVSTTLATASADSLTESDTPFSWDGSLTGDTAIETLNLKTGDAVWRTYAVIPWCMIQFGSLEACEQYGADWLRLEAGDGNIIEARNNYVDSTIKDAEGGDDAATVLYLTGQSPAQRTAVAALAFLTAIGVVVILGGLPILALLTWVTALLLLSLGVLWACLLVVPGRTRAIGVALFEAAIGLTFLSAITTGLLSAVLIVATAAMTLTADLGWLPMAIVGLAVLAGATKARRIIESTVTSGAWSSRGVAGAVTGIAGGVMARKVLGGLGGLARRSASNVARGASRGLTRGRGQAATVGAFQARGRGGGAAGPGSTTGQPTGPGPRSPRRPDTSGRTLHEHARQDRTPTERQQLSSQHDLARSETRGAARVRPSAARTASPGPAPGTPRRSNESVASGVQDARRDLAARAGLRLPIRTVESGTFTSAPMRAATPGAAGGSADVRGGGMVYRSATPATRYSPPVRTGPLPPPVTPVVRRSRVVHHGDVLRQADHRRMPRPDRRVPSVWEQQRRVGTVADARASAATPARPRGQAARRGGGSRG